MAGQWPGDPLRADPDQIPDLDFMDRTNPASLTPGYLHVKANYELLSDNIMDLSHIDYLHPTTLAQGNLGTARPTSGAEGNRVWIRWQAHDVEPSPMNALSLGENTRINVDTEVVWYPAGNMHARVVMTSTDGSPRKDTTYACHLMTPETLTTTHYFFCDARDFQEDDVEMTAARARIRTMAFDQEDKPMLEAVQRAMGTDCDLLSMRPTVLPSDKGALRARRILHNLMRSESDARGLSIVHSS